MFHLEFTTAHAYGSDREGITVPVLLKSGPNTVGVAASIDTGATFCIFRNELAEALGLDLSNTASKRFRTAAGSFEAFGHDVEISVLGTTTFSTVYFFADASINKNVLGRVGWLDRVQLALVDHDSTLYIAPYGND
jgi:predicted aspartyl protease